MASKSDEAGKTASAANPFAEMRLPGFENMASFGTAWMDAMGDMSAEFASFVAARIQEDVNTQKAMMRCKSIEEFQSLQTEFMRKAMEQYKAETGRLAEIGMKAFDPKKGAGDK